MNTDSVQDLEILVEFGNNLSNAVANRKCDWHQERASIVFSKVLLTTINFLRITPGSSVYTKVNGCDVVDIASSASLCRNVIEGYLLLVFLTHKSWSREDRTFHRLLWNYHRVFQKHEMLRSVPDSSETPKLAQELRIADSRLKNSVVFQRLSKNIQKKFLGGSHFKPLSKKHLADLGGVSSLYLDYCYKYTSNHVHSTPHSLQIMDECRVGTPKAQREFNHLVMILVGYVALSVGEYSKLFASDQIRNVSHVQKIISLWRGIMKWEKNPGAFGKDKI